MQATSSDPTGGPRSRLRRGGEVALRRAPRRHAGAGFASLLVAATLACGGVEGTPEPPPGAGGDAASVDRAEAAPGDDGAEIDEVAAAANRFAVALLAELGEREGNLFFSPFSVASALAMTSAGAAGTTREEMLAVLGLEAGGGEPHAAFGALLGALASGGDEAGFRLHLANRIWGQRGFDFLDGFLEICRRDYGAPLETLDFRAAAEAARATINGWVAERTAGRIDDLLPPGSVDAMTRLVLTNAIYFKGDWREPFDPEATAAAPFRLAGGGEAPARFMRRTASFGYAEVDAGGGLQLLGLPYAGERLSMVVLLPREVAGLPALEGALDAARLDEWIGRLAEQKVEVHLPRFESDSTFELEPALAALGMPSAFRDPAAGAGGADFSAMTGERDLFIDQVFHRAFVAVDEEGTEAAAATGVTMQLTMAVARTPVFRADRPFLYLIRDDETGTILFLGRLADPS